MYTNKWVWVPVHVNG